MANTLIQLKHSLVTNIPPSLNVAEPAYSYSSNTLFIGNSSGTGVVNVGGQFYTLQIDNATDSSVPNTLVRRDANGNVFFNSVTANSISGNTAGNAESASKWLSPIDFGLAGDATGNVSVDGSANVTLTVDLTNSGVTAGVYGGTTQIPVINIGADGRITSASNTNVATILSFAADGATTGNLSILTDTLTIEGGDGITTTANNDTNTILVELDNTIIRTTGDQNINGSLTVTGDLTILGNTTSVNVSTLSVEDSLIALAKNNVTDVVDIGFYGHYNDGTDRHTGLFRYAGDQQFYIFDNYDKEPTANTINIADPSFVIANLVVNIRQGTVSNLTQAIAVSDGGTGRNTFTTGSIVIGNGTGGLLELANTSSTGTYANASHVPVITVDAYGRVSGVVNTLIDINTSQITSGILGVSRGGSGASTFTANGVLLGQGTDPFTVASSSTEGHILTINASGVPTFVMLSGGTF